MKLYDKILRCLGIICLGIMAITISYEIIMWLF